MFPASQINSTFPLVTVNTGNKAKSLSFAREASGNRQITNYIMAPLKITDWDKFDRDLQSVKEKGIQGVTIDVWWGKVEGQGDQVFDWSYYDKAFRAIKDKGLKIIPILSFHKCGGNVGDNGNVPIPEWAWDMVARKASQEAERPMGVSDIQYKNEQGRKSDDVIPVWLDKFAMPQYLEFMTEFKNHFGDKYHQDFTEINISLGPSGELRYPAYGPKNRGESLSDDLGTLAEYPNRGSFVGYSTYGTQSFRNFAREKYGSLDNIKGAWGLQSRKTRIEDLVYLPRDSREGDGFASNFVRNKCYENTAYGKDFIRWYNGSLVEHGKQMLETAHGVFDGETFTNADIGFKIPGVHWRMGRNKIGDTEDARLAEITAGVISTDQDYNSETTDYGYNRILDMAKDIHDRNKRKNDTVVHFTCLEKENNIDDGEPDANSRAKDLTKVMLKGAQNRGLTIKGENALPDRLIYAEGFENLKEAINEGYDGVTILRIDNFSDDLPHEETGKARHKLYEFCQWIEEKNRQNSLNVKV